MALLDSVIKIPTKAQIGYLKLDASISENHVRTADVTENEIEDGSIVSDHIRLRPKSLTMNGQISDFPVSILGLGVSTDDILGASRDFISGSNKNAFKDLGDSFKNQFASSKGATSEDLVRRADRSPREAWKYLEELWERKVPFSVVTGLQRYENMVISNLSSPRNATDGDSLMFSAELKKIKTVESSDVLIPSVKMEQGGPANSGSSKTKTGKQTTGESSASQEIKSSILYKLSKRVGL
jgi:hypothetical protein